MEIKLLSSLEKCFVDEDLSRKEEFSHATALSGELFSFQLGVYNDGADRDNYTLTVDAAGADVQVSRVRSVPVRLAAFADFDDDFLRKTPGLYPDLLDPADIAKHFFIPSHSTDSWWFEVQPVSAPGKYPVKITVANSSGTYSETVIFTLDVLPAKLPDQQIIVTNWFHCDCIATAYGEQVFSETHWRHVENFIRTAVKYGINMILTPVLTPELDTEIGFERPTAQLVDIKVTDGAYRFGYAKLDRWIDMCERLGVKYYEISHLFSQWGAESAPKVMATQNGEYKRIFGWETPSDSPEYTAFLRKFLTSLVRHLKKRGVDKRCFYHISDEPHGGDALETYRKCRASVADILKDYVIMDALSDYEFYRQGVVSAPIPCNNAIQPFIDNGVPDLWTYYCCGQGVKVSNQFIAMPSYRNRVIGWQFFKYRIFGFLQWGYNFYYSHVSQYPVDPFTVTDADAVFPAGDPFKVYPGMNGEALPSIRLVVFDEALRDLRAMKLLESLTSHEYVVKLMEKKSGEVTFFEYPRSARAILDLREAVNREIKKRI